MQPDVSFMPSRGSHASNFDLKKPPALRNLKLRGLTGAPATGLIRFSSAGFAIASDLAAPVLDDSKRHLPVRCRSSVSSSLLFSAHIRPTIAASLQFGTNGG